MNDSYRIALRNDAKDRLDDVVVKDVSMFRAEMMSTKELWLCCYFPGTNERVTFWVRAKGGRLEFDVTEQPIGDEFTYEEQG